MAQSLSPKALRLKGLRENIKRQEDLVKAKNADYRKFAKQSKEAIKGKGIKAEMQRNLTLNSKKQDAFRTKQRLDQMKLNYQAEKKK